MTKKESTAAVVVVFVCFLTILPSTALESFDIACESEFVPIGESFCPGVPVFCTVLLSTSTCSQNGSQDSVEVGKGNLTVLIMDWSGNYTMIDFAVDQTNFTLEIATIFLPSDLSTELTVQISSSNIECEFNVSMTDYITTTEDCLYPLILETEIINLSSATPLKGGSLISLTLEINATSSNLSNLTLALGSSHPTLDVISYSPNDDPSIHVTPYNTVVDTHTIPIDSDPFLVVSEFPANSTFLVNVTLHVSNFVLPKSVLYFSFCAYYHSSYYDLLTIQQSSPQIRDFVAASPFIGDWSFSLPFYDGIDHKENTFPPNEGDIFIISVPVILPCVSTELNISVIIPEYSHDIYTYFYTNVTVLNFSTPSNLLSVPQLCDNTQSQSGCTIEGATPPSPAITLMEAAGPGKDIFVVEFGALVYNLSSGGCVNDNNCSGSCYEEEITLTLSGHVVTEMICENQTLADNVAVEIVYTTESTSWPGSGTSELVDAIDSVLFPVNASMPAIDLPISSHRGDAGDSFNITFGILHNVQYSSFSAYDLNYTFSIDPHLDPSENITICFFNTTSDDPVSCEGVPFENYTISRLGYHEVYVIKLMYAAVC